MIEHAARASTERVLCLRDALSLAHAEFRALGLTIEMHEFGEGATRVTRVDACDRRGRIVDGLGKGAGDQRLASACFEAIEHYWLQYGFDLPGSDAGAAKSLSIDDIVAQSALCDDQVLVRLATEFPGVRIRCMPYARFGRADATVWYPLFLKNPFARGLTEPPDDGSIYESYFRYASSNGIASGATEEDAELHALLEIIERDAVSIALLDWFGDRAQAARPVARDSLPGDLAALHDAVAATMGTPPALLDVTTDLGVSAMMAIPSTDIGGCGLYGAGASLDPAYAAERALSELAQAYFVHAEHPELGERYRRHALQLERWPLLSRSVNLAPADILRRAEAVTLPRSPDHKGSVAQQIEAVLSRLARCGFVAWKHRCNPGVAATGDRNRVVVTSVLIPGLESFFLATSGQAVLPTGRGWRRFQTAMSGAA